MPQIEKINCGMFCCVAKTGFQKMKKIVLPETQQGAPLFENHKNN